MSVLKSAIYLTGFMASGKSTIGAMMARKLGLDFVDLDATIALRAGKPIERLFAEEGENFFRTLETQTLRKMQTPAVYALGGGTLTVEANLQWALHHGIVVYLRVPTHNLVRRLLRAKSVRPLLLDTFGQRLSAPALTQKVQRMLTHRAPFYEKAKHTIEVRNQDADATASAATLAIQQHLSATGDEKSDDGEGWAPELQVQHSVPGWDTPHCFAIHSPDILHECSA